MIASKNRSRILFEALYPTQVVAMVPLNQIMIGIASPEPIISCPCFDRKITNIRLNNTIALRLVTRQRAKVNPPRKKYEWKWFARTSTTLFWLIVLIWWANALLLIINIELNDNKKNFIVINHECFYWLQLIIIRITLSIVTVLQGEIIADQIHGLIFKTPFIYFFVMLLRHLVISSALVSHNIFSRLSNYCNWPKNGQKWSYWVGYL